MTTLSMVVAATACESSSVVEPGETQTGGGSTTSAGAPTCDGDQAILLDGQDTGFVECSGGSIDRPAANVCPFASPGDCLGTEDALDCSTDSDCNGQPGGSCVAGEDPDVGNTWCSCSYQCATDADCDNGQVCRCAGVGLESPRNQCIPADCNRNADCASVRCGLSQWQWCNPNYCGTLSKMACRTDEDSCDGNASCGDDVCAQCPEDPAWSCRTTGDCPCPPGAC